MVAFLLSFASLAIWAAVYLISAFSAPPQIAVLPNVPAHDSTFIFLSDTQSPLWPETFVLDENGNEAARATLLRKVASADPGAVFHCGDLVALGFNQKHWEPIDRFTADLSRKAIPFFPVPGNHEYMIFAETGINNFRARYPFARETGYSAQIGPLAVVLLNSNIANMSTEQVATQKHWYKGVMRSLESDSLVRGIIVACHHAPFTNSRIVDPSAEVQKQFVPGFIASEKGLAFISGHCHAFEHFEVGGKQFLVAGGGGGLQQPLLLGERQRWRDLFDPQTETRMFHYLEGLVNEKGVEINVRMLSNDFTGFETAYTMAIPW